MATREMECVFSKTRACTCKCCHLMGVYVQECRLILCGSIVVLAIVCEIFGARWHRLEIQRMVTVSTALPTVDSFKDFSECCQGFVRVVCVVHFVRIHSGWRNKTKWNCAAKEVFVPVHVLYLVVSYSSIRHVLTNV